MTGRDPRALERFVARCRNAGFDVVHPFGVEAYNARVEARLRLPAPNASLGLLVGNTRVLWDAFCRALSAEPSLLGDEHPLDRYARDRIGAAAESLDPVHAILWADGADPSPVPVQHVAHATGLAWLSPSHLNVHPTYGPWLAFRAVVIADAGPPPRLAQTALNPCARCAKPCVEALARAVEQSATLAESAVREHFDLWRRVRDVCPEGSGHRYGEEQIRYHYTKDRRILRTVAAR